MKALIVVIPFLLLACNQKKDDFKTPEKAPVAEYQEGKKLMETHCYVCHNPNTPENEGRIAPPLVAVKARYMMEGMSHDAFVAAVTSFVDHPTEDKVLLQGAFNRFGLMPKQVFPDESVEKIAAYIYDYQIEEPVWFKEHWQRKGNPNWTQSGQQVATEVKPKTTAEIGLEYALSTKKILGKNLMGAIQQKGTLAALEFCNIQAIPLTDSMAKVHHASIKRVSDKNRNPNNKANAEELKYIAQFKADLTAKKESKPVVIEKGDKVQFYYPILTNTMCLQCHGKQVNPDVQKQILKLYPKDLAIGYGENEVRGIWSITFDKKL